LSLVMTRTMKNDEEHSYVLDFRCLAVPSVLWISSP
jgi:hypothetical protein